MIIDLSVNINSDTPTFPGDPSVTIQRTSSLAENGYITHEVRFGTHSGTHIDAPAHMLENSATMDMFPLNTFVGTGKLLRGFSKSEIEKAKIEKGDIVLFDTGTSRRFSEPSYFTDYPVMPEFVVDYLIKKKIKLVGLDTCSADNVREFPVHKRLLAANIPIIENLTNLSSLHGKHFIIHAMPLKLWLDGAPVRAYAVAKDA